MSYLIFGCLCISLFCLLLLGTKRKKESFDLILLSWHLLIVINFLVIFLTAMGEEKSFPFLLKLSTAVSFLHGPILLLYCRSILSIKRLTHTDFLHTLPFFFVFVLQYISAFQTSNQSTLFYGVVSLFGIGSVVIYMFIIYRMISRVSVLSEQILSTREIDRLNWLKNLSVLISISAILFIPAQIMFQFTELKLPQYGNSYANSAFCFVVLIIQFNGLRQAALYGSEEVNILMQPIPSEPISTATPVSESQMNHITLFMQENKPHLNPEINLYDLAAQLGYSAHDLSQILNSGFKKNFFDFINEYRVEEVKRRIALRHFETMTFLGIALESGFNSKTSFNRAFKKFTSSTPQKFVEALKNRK